MEQPKLQAHALSVELLSHALCYGLSERTLLRSAGINIVRDARTCFREERLCKPPCMRYIVHKQSLQLPQLIVSMIRMSHCHHPRKVPVIETSHSELLWRNWIAH